MNFYKALKRSAAAVLSAFFAVSFGTAGYYSVILPKQVTAEPASVVSFAGYPEISCTDSADSSATLSLFGAIPVKNVSVQRSEAPVLIAGGMPFGVKLLMEGVMVTELGRVDCSGEDVCPAALAGVEVGDIIRSADGTALTSNADLQRVIAQSEGNDVELAVSRGGAELSLELTPVLSESTGKWRGGMWVRDSIAGIGTMTFINKDTGEFAGLGHPVCDTDTGEMIPIQSGEAVPVEITGARKGAKGIPGELQGRFTRSQVCGVITGNSPSGIHGVLSDTAMRDIGGISEEYKLGYRQEISAGEAYILSTVEGSEPKKYTAVIEQIDYNSKEPSKNMVIRITDPDLIEASGGIVQGMSGSPIIQNGRLIGAVTHVFVADPTRGYAIFAENMLNG